MAATDQCCNVKKALANSEPSTHGPSRHFAATQQFGRFRSEADIQRAASTAHALDAKLAKKVPKRMIGHALTMSEASAVLDRLSV